MIFQEHYLYDYTEISFFEILEIILEIFCGSVGLLNDACGSGWIG